MVLRDSYGVPFEPEEPKVIAFDWNGEPVYEGAYCYVIDDLIIPEDDFEQWKEDVIGQATPLHREDIYG